MHHRRFCTNCCFSLKGQVSFIALLLFALVQCSFAGSSHTPSGEGGSCGKPDLETENKIIAALKSLKHMMLQSVLLCWNWFLWYGMMSQMEEMVTVNPMRGKL